MRQQQRLAFIDTDGRTTTLDPAELGTAAYDEAWLRELIFRQPEVLPIADIEPRTGTLIPLCTELRCGTGRVDAVFCDRSGHLVLVECKLWRNPEARRRVVTQILDYAAELKGWGYADLEREVNARCGSALPLFQRVTSGIGEEARFVDVLARNLHEGRFTLLVVGDGIREETERLAAFLTDNMNLRFHLALVEVRPHKLPNGALVLAAAPLVRTRLIERVVAVSAPSEDIDGGDGSDGKSGRPERVISAEAKEADDAFWSPLLRDLRLDDPEQEVPRRGQIENKRFRLPGGAWLTAYRYRAGNRIGVALVLPNDDRFETLAAELRKHRREALAELPKDSTEWRDDSTWLCCTFVQYENVHDRSTWPDQRRFFEKTINQYVNLFRPCLRKISINSDLHA